MKFDGTKVPEIDPPIKESPRIKLRGKFTDSFPKNLTLFLIPLFWIPNMSIIKKQKFTEKEKIIFLIESCIN